MRIVGLRLSVTNLCVPAALRVRQVKSRPLGMGGLAVCVGVLILVAMSIGCQQNETPSDDSSPAQTATAAADTNADDSADTTAGDGASKSATDEPVGTVQLSEQELADGWISLFDGETLFGWKHEGKADWHVENGCIVVAEGENSLLVTTTEFANYVLRVKFRCEPSTNSGVFLRTTMDPQDVTTDCYELNIAGTDNPFPTGSLVQRQKVNQDLNRSDWQSYEVRVQQGRIVVQLDGKQVLDYTDPNPIPRGYIGLQLNQGRIEFRDIQLKPLGLTSIFNGKDLTGWKTYPDMESEFSVDPRQQTLNVVNGSGQIETEAQYGDFVLQLECITHAPDLNSGIFFRCIPGEKMNGYECQIHNGFLDGDRTKPKDCGTGGIFRRQEARKVVADDMQWFHMTVIADGPHMAAWVNGYQVSDWTDQRKPDPNPRRGLRLEPGTIMIQGHDPTTNLSFRNLRIASVPRRSAP